MALSRWESSVPDGFDSELRMAVAEGLLSKKEAEALHSEALRLGRPPLELLVEQGRLSADSLASLRREYQEEPTRTSILPAGAPPHDDTMTVKPPSRELPAVGAMEFPVPGWERYQPIRLLGQGGMGRVFLAHDPRLRRDVALKFVRDDDPDSARRFVFEARAQARVVHERVCQVYEVGEVEGKTYIAMQYIDGKPLNLLAKQLTVEQKAMVLRDVAEGVHEAHRAGLIHRDLKPSNIMVARSQDGKLEPYVVDFGLARDWKEGVTATGSVVGTPHYMAPEQARGEVSRLDRRADVYSLGATLYHLLTGSHPVQGSNHLEVLSNISTVEPRPLRALDADIPADLEAIVLKCLEKERSARYDSARALAEDLSRFLNGELVHARPTGTWYRLRKKVRKHRAAVAMGSGALVLVTLALGQAALERSEASERARLASRFTAKVKDIESHALQSHLSPAHDTRPDRESIRAWMRELEADMREAGNLGQGPGHYALGQGYLALGDTAKAREHLDAAWARGYHEPRAAYALALVLGNLYQQQLLEAERQYQQLRAKTGPGDTSPLQQLEARKRELERHFRDPALGFLRRSEGAPVPPDYVAALIAFFEGRHDEALARLDALGNGPPGFYAAPMLRGDIFLASATRHWSQGRYEQARAAFGASRRSYERAADIGRSDPAVHHALAQLERAELEMELYGQGNIEPPLQRGLQAVARALTVAPDHYESRVLEARFHRRLAEHHATRGAEAREHLQKALAAAQEAWESAPARPEARLELGALFLHWGRLRQKDNLEPYAQLQKAAELLEGIAPEDQDGEVHLMRGLVYMTWAKHQQQSGLDSLPMLGRAIDAFRLAIRLDESQLHARIDLVNAYLLRASLPRGPEPEGDLEQAGGVLDEVRTRNPRYVLRYFYEGQLHEHLARHVRARGEDARPELEKALARYQEGLAIDAGLTYLLNATGLVLVQLAHETWDHGGDPFPRLDQAQRTFERAIALAPRGVNAYNNLGWVHARRATYLSARGEEPSPSVHAAEAAFQQAIDRAPEHHTPWANLSLAHYTRAAFELEHERDPRRSLERASEAVLQALNRTPSDSDNSLNLGRVRELQARWKAQRGQARDEDFEEAARAFRRALDLDPANQDSRLAFGHFHREWAFWKRKSGEDPAPVLAQGLTLAEDVLRARPRWPQARLLRASLLLEQAEDSAAGQQGLLNQAREELTQALKDNPHLAREWEPRLPRMRQLLDGSRSLARHED
ncbi:serine/threonine-protein kinase [Archangium lansingense]|uniref:Protein kinase n=1 Tax=Archangium lansingense TaxID=2995310 RepID=A0ABT3ZWV1_9BACT|nr:serine/threonine-protein kinase [Archangium lansinium]MCY1073865.1 protein kinase [Archangium lansinium]